MFVSRLRSNVIVPCCRLLSSLAEPSARHDSLTFSLATRLDEIKASGKYKDERIISSSQSEYIRKKPDKSPIRIFRNSACRRNDQRHFSVESLYPLDHFHHPALQQLHDIGSNNYLGLSNHPKIVEGAEKALQRYGYGLSSARFICGTQDIHKQLEKQISEFHEMEDAILYASCFDANAGLFESLLTKDDIVFSDMLNHASIIDGIRLCKAKRMRYKHMDMEDLRFQLNSEESKNSRFRLIATDGAFSMDGEIAPLKEICDLADEFDAYVFVDDCHATGFLGKQGRGSAEYCGVEGRVDVINSTLGKAMGGGTGGYTTANSEIIQTLRQTSRPYLFSNSIPPMIVGASIAAFDLIKESDEPRQNLMDNMSYFRKEMTKEFELCGSGHPIIPVMLYDAQKTRDIAHELLQKGVYVIGFSYPVVPEGKARIRVQLSALHTKHQLTEATEKFINVGKQFGMLRD